MFNVVVEIKAPELVESIKLLAAALAGNSPIQTVQSQAPLQPQQDPTLGYGQQSLNLTDPQQQTQPVMLVQPIQPQQPMQPQQPQQTQFQAPQTAPASVPTTAPAYTMDQLAVAATQIVDAGRRNELVNLLATFGVQALTALPIEQYGNFATHLRSLGAKI